MLTTLGLPRIHGRQIFSCLAISVFLLSASCARFYFYKPALVRGAVVSAETGEPISGARVSFETRAGDVIANAPVAWTLGDGSFEAGSREARTLRGFEMMEAIEAHSPVTLRIEADGYQPKLLDVEGKAIYRSPIALVLLSSVAGEKE
jgi:hypothetical protein